MKRRFPWVPRKCEGNGNSSLEEIKVSLHLPIYCNFCLTVGAT